jgi:hypothetical protein
MKIDKPYLNFPDPDGLTLYSLNRAGDVFSWSLDDVDAKN